MFDKQWLKVLSYILLLACCFGSQTSQADELPPQTDPFPPLVPISQAPDKLKPLARIGDGWINDVALSPDNKTLAVATTIGVYLYDVEAFDEEPIRLDDDNSYIRDIAYSPDGRYLAVSGDTLQLWDTAKNVVTKQIDDVTDAVNLVFSPDSTQLAFFALFRLKIWKHQIGEIKEIDRGGFATDVSFSLDGSRLIATLDAGEWYWTKIWDTDSGIEISKNMDAFSDTWLAYPETEGWIGVYQVIERWDKALEKIVLSNATPQIEFSRNRRIRAARLSLEHQHALYLNGEGLLIKVDTESLEITASTSLAWNGWIAEFSQDASLLVTATSSHIQIWNVDEGDLFAERDHFAMPIPVAFSRDRKFFATLSSDPYDVLIHDAVTNAVISRIRGHPGATRLVAFSPSGQLLATTGADNTVRIWDTAKGTPTQVVYNINREIRFLKFRGEAGIYLLSGNSTFELYDLNENKFAGLTSDLNGLIYQMQLETDKRVTIFGGESPGLVWGTEQGELYFQMGDTFDWYNLAYNDLLKRPFNAIATMQVEKYYNQKIAAAGNNGVVLLFDGIMPDLDKTTTLTRHDSWIYALEFSPDDHVLASAGCAETQYRPIYYGGPPSYIPYCVGADLQLWYSLEPYYPAYSEPYLLYKQSGIPVDHTMPIHKVIFNNEGTILTTFSADGTMIHWGVLEEDASAY